MTNVGSDAPLSMPQTEVLAIVAMGCGIASIVVCGLFGIVGIVLGFRAQWKIEKSNGLLTGKGFALTGIITGFIGVTILILSAVLILFLWLRAIQG